MLDMPRTLKREVPEATTSLSEPWRSDTISANREPTAGKPRPPSWMAVLVGLAGACSATPVVPPDRLVGRAPGHDSVSIEYEVVSTGPTTLVFVHGWMCDRTYWREQLDHFSDRFGVVALDLGGHGASGMNRVDWSVDSFAGDVLFTDASDPALVQRILDQMTAGSPEVGIPATLSMFEWYRDRAVKSLNLIDRPIWTVNSAEYIGTDVERLQELVPGIQVRTLAGVGHFVMLEAPDAFNRVLDQVLARVLGRL